MTWTIIFGPNENRISKVCLNEPNIKILTVSGHPHHQAFLKAALLAAVSVDPHDGAALVLKALLILDVLLDAPSEEALCVHKDR